MLTSHQNIPRFLSRSQGNFQPCPGCHEQTSIWEWLLMHMGLTWHRNKLAPFFDLFLSTNTQTGSRMSSILQQLASPGGRTSSNMTGPIISQLLFCFLCCDISASFIKTFTSPAMWYFIHFSSVEWHWKIIKICMFATLSSNKILVEMNNFPCFVVSNFLLLNVCINNYFLFSINI